MAETLTESFCERCGTRYTFESSAPGQRRLGGLKVLGRGLKHFVMSDDSSLDESIAVARSDVERDATNHQLDAFHRTFNFCMSCRQYTCANCWNGAEARCLSCAPLAVPEPELSVANEVEPERLLRLMGDHSHDHGHDEQPPEADEMPPVAAITDTQMIDDTQPIADTETSGTSSAGQPALDGMAPGQTLDDAIAAFEASLVIEDETAPSPVLGPEQRSEPAAVTVPAEKPESVTVAEPEPGAPFGAPADIEPEAEAPIADSTAADVEPAPTIEPEIPIAAKPGPEVEGIDAVAQPIWPVPSPPAAAPQWPAAAPQWPAAAPQWPTGPRWPTGISARQDPSVPEAPVDALAALMSRSPTDAMWAASSQEILQPIAPTQPVAAIQACNNCGISLSANARFCRRCGTAQG